MDSVDFLGYVGGLLVFSTFYLKTMARLRIVAIASNVAFIGYGYLAGIWPVLLLHMLMMPLNIVRLRELQQRHETNGATTAERQPG